MTGGPRSDDDDFLAIGRPRLYHVAGQGLPQISEKPLHRPDRDSLIVLSTVAGLFAWVIANTPGHRRERHVFLNQRIGIEILAALHQVEIALDLFVSPAGIVAGRHLVAVDGSNRTPVAGGEQVLALFLRGRWSNAGESDLKAVRNVCAFG